MNQPVELPSGAALGSAATIVQFSSAFCQPCRATRSVIARVVADIGIPGVNVVEIDADDNPRPGKKARLEVTLTVPAAPAVAIIDESLCIGCTYCRAACPVEPDEGDDGDAQGDGRRKALPKKNCSGRCTRWANARSWCRAPGKPIVATSLPFIT